MIIPVTIILNSFLPESLCLLLTGITPASLLLYFMSNPRKEDSSNSKVQRQPVIKWPLNEKFFQTSYSYLTTKVQHDKQQM